MSSAKLPGERWDQVAPFYCVRCERDQTEGWSYNGYGCACPDCGTQLRASKWLVRFYTTPHLRPLTVRQNLPHSSRPTDD